MLFQILISCGWMKATNLSGALTGAIHIDPKGHFLGDETPVIFSCSGVLAVTTHYRIRSFSIQIVSDKQLLIFVGLYWFGSFIMMYATYLLIRIKTIMLLLEPG